MNKQWINVSHDFGLPSCCLTLSTREAAMHRMRHALTISQDDPVKLEAEITAIIRDCRPELVGGVLTGMDMSGWMQMRFYYWHPKLPRMKAGDMMVELPLIPPVNEPVVADVPTLVDMHADPLMKDLHHDKPYDPPVTFSRPRYDNTDLGENG